MKDFLNENYIYLIIIGFTLYGLILIAFTIRKKKKDKQFEIDSPDIAKVHLEAGISVRADQKLRMFSEKLHTGYYLEPGQHTLYVTYYYEKMTKRVTVLESAVLVEVEAGLDYELSYDRKSEQYVFAQR